MERIFTIYQMDINNKNCFMGSAEEDIKVDLKEDYDKIFAGTLKPSEDAYEKEMELLKDDYAVLEYLFEAFNIRHPENYKGRSLSVSDVVKLDDKYYFCDSFGWKEIKIEE